MQQLMCRKNCKSGICFPKVTSNLVSQKHRHVGEAMSLRVYCNAYSDIRWRNMEDDCGDNEQAERVSPQMSAKNPWHLMA